MIRAYLEAKNPDHAIEIYWKMRANGVELNRFTLLHVLKAYAFRPSYREGIVVHGKIVKLGFYLDPFICNALIHMYSKCGDICSAQQVFNEMPERTLVNWNTIIAACFSCGDVENGRRLFGELPERNIESWNVVIVGYNKLGYVDIARSWFDKMLHRDLVSWSAMISGYVHNKRAMEALELFKKMQFSGLSPDSITLTSILSACVQIGALDMGRWIHAYMEKKKLTHDVILATCLIDMYAKCGLIETAFVLFHGMPMKNLCMWNAMLSGLSIHGHGSAVMEVFREMEFDGMEFDDVTFVAVLSVCSHVGWVDEGWKQFNRMSKDFGIVPKIEHYGCMVDLLSRAGLIDEAIELIKTMPIEPNVVIWGALLNACKIHGYEDIGGDLGEYALKSAVGDGGGCTTLLSNMFASRNQWTEVEKTRRMMRVKKTPGCSSIEVNGVVHEFFVGDRLNSNWSEVSDVIERINSHIEFEVSGLSLVSCI